MIVDKQRVQSGSPVPCRQAVEIVPNRMELVALVYDAQAVLDRALAFELVRLFEIIAQLGIVAVRPSGLGAVISPPWQIAGLDRI